MVFDKSAGEEIYGSFASGSLDPALQLLVETQSALRSDDSTRLTQAEIVAGTFLETQRPATMAAGALERALASIDRLDHVNEASKASAGAAAGNALDELIRLPEPLRERVLEQAGASGWKFAGPGLRIMPLELDSDASVELLRIEPGHGAPSHTHRGSEYTLVLTGSFTDETGHYAPGDISIAGPDTVHRPIADPGDVCFALAVRDGGLEFKGMLGMIQRAMGR